MSLFTAESSQMHVMHSEEDQSMKLWFSSQLRKVQNGALVYLRLGLFGENAELRQGHAQGVMTSKSRRMYLRLGEKWRQKWDEGTLNFRANVAKFPMSLKKCGTDCVCRQPSQRTLK